MAKTKQTLLFCYICDFPMNVRIVLEPCNHVICYSCYALHPNECKMYSLSDIRSHIIGVRRKYSLLRDFLIMKEYNILRMTLDIPYIEPKVNKRSNKISSTLCIISICVLISFCISFAKTVYSVLVKNCHL